MANPVELYDGGILARLFKFDPMPTGITFTLSKVGNSPLDIPGQIRPWMFDFTSQSRVISIRATLMSINPWDESNPGTGSILDQLEDLLYIMSANWTASGGMYLLLYVPYPSAMDAGHNAMLTSTYYTDSGNTDYDQDRKSVPINKIDPLGSNVYRTAMDKLYYVYPQEMTIERDEASVNRVHVTLSFTEINMGVKI